MCCADDRPLELPAAVIEMLARYRDLQRRRGHGWGEEALPDFFTWARFSLLGPAFDEFAATGDWARAVRAALEDSGPLPGLVVVELSEGSPETRHGPAKVGLAGRPVAVDVVVLAPPDRDGTAMIDREPVTVAAGQAGLRTLDVDPARTPHSPPPATLKQMAHLAVQRLLEQFRLRAAPALRRHLNIHDARNSAASGGRPHGRLHLCSMKSSIVVS